jgi:zinc finger HIT domain-containing protein 1
MNNFGVIEVASAKTTNAPGWAYVPDTGPALSHASSAAGGAQPRKRARNAGAANLSHADLTARQQAKVRRELEVLDRDNARDVSIPVPPKAGHSRTGGKHTANVRKILQSQKTFANYLDDFIAMGAGADTTSSGPAASAAAGNVTGGSSRSAAAAASAAIRGARTAGAAAQQTQRKSEGTPAAKSSGKQAAAAEREAAASEDVEMADVTASQPSVYLQSYAGPLPPAHPSDDDPLLVSRIPPLPSDEELRALLSAPPLTYLDAKAGWNDEDRRYPTRVFCEVCGYWGKVRCMKCGTRVCALDCLETHREECVTRYGL